MNEPFTHQTKHGFVVACNSYENCYNSTVGDGINCKDCSRNKYSLTKTIDNFSRKGVCHEESVQKTIGSFQSGDLSITFGAMFKDCKILINGKPVKDLIAFNIVGQLDSLVFYQLTFSGNPGPGK